MVMQQLPYTNTVYYHKSTTNQSFLDMHYYLKDKGIENNKFFLALYDTDLLGIDPYDPNLTYIQRAKVLRECTINFWYFIREVLRIPSEGGTVGHGIRYKLHRGNLALNFLLLNNCNVFLELPRQHFKTTSACSWYLWVFNFRTSNSEIMFINQKHDKAKANLTELKNLRANLPSYLRMSEPYGRDGSKPLKVQNTMETLQHPSNYNRVKTLPGAKNKTSANSAGRGCKMPMQWYDEFAFIIYNKIIYEAATPAFSRASKNAAINNAPYGILITTTPGDLTTDEGLFAELVKNNATAFIEEYFNKTPAEIQGLKDSNTKSNFFYVRYSYLQLGSGEDYFQSMIKEMQHDWVSIRREILLEWSTGATNCPFAKEDIENIRRFVLKEPIDILLFGRYGQYQVHIWAKLDFRLPPIMGVDVAGAHCLDSSAFTIIDSKTTAVAATFNCNYIPTDEFADLIINIVQNYIQNCIVNVERNGGFGGSVLERLIKSPIKDRLYYEVKDKILEERTNGVTVCRRQQKVKEYGINNTHTTRERLIELLHDRVNYHKDKFIASILVNELETMEVKKNGRTEHASNSHDDQIFSYLMAIYVWYDGKDLLSNFGLRRSEIKTDQDISNGFVPLEEKYTSNINIDVLQNSAVNEIIEEQLKILNSGQSKDSFKTFNQWEQEQILNEQKEIEQLKQNNKLFRESYNKKYNVSADNDIEVYTQFTIPDSFFNDYYETESNNTVSHEGYVGNLANDFYNLRNS